MTEEKIPVEILVPNSISFEDYEHILDTFREMFKIYKLDDKFSVTLRSRDYTERIMTLKVRLQ